MYKFQYCYQVNNGSKCKTWNKSIDDFLTVLRIEKQILNNQSNFQFLTGI